MAEPSEPISSPPVFPGRVRMIIVTVLAGLLVLAALAIDPMVNAWVVDRATPGVKRVAEAFSRSGEAQWPIGVAVVGLIFAWSFDRPDWRRVALAVLLATALSGVTAMVGRAVTGRARPYNPVEQGWFGPYHGGQWVGLLHAYSSFPSGHAATSAGFAVALTLVARRWGWLALFWMTGVAWSRICLRAHNFSDVTAGCLLGLGFAVMIYRVFGQPRLVCARVIDRHGLTDD